MNRSKALWFVMSLLVISSMVLAACAPATPAPTQAPAAQPVETAQRFRSVSLELRSVERPVLAL